MGSVSAPAWPRPCADPACTTEVRPRPAPYRERHEARGLCAPCYYRHGRAGTLAEFPAFTWPAESLAFDAEIVRRRETLTWAQVADRLGVTADALDQARVRTRRRARAGSAR